MQLDKLPPSYLFRTHSKKEISKWASGLKYFYFIRASGGFTDDGDRFETIMSYADKEDLFEKLLKLDISLSKIPPNYPEPILGKEYTGAEFEMFKIKSRIKEFPDFEQPGRTSVRGIKCFIWISGGEILFYISGTANDNPYDVLAADFEASKSLEKIFDYYELGGFNREALEVRPTCILRRNYPELFT